jgi:hypothetical protein
VEFKVDLDVFSGPMDLLLYLVKKHEVDVTEVPIAVIAGEFIAYLDVLEDLAIDQVGAVLAPAGALGGAAVLAAAERGIPVIAVHNPCLLQVDAEALGLEVLPAASYGEAAGLVLALREGLSPAALRRPL